MNLEAHAIHFSFGSRPLQVAFLGQLAPIMAEGAEQESALAWPEKHSLTTTWEQNILVQEAFRSNDHHLLKWPSRELIGVASLRALALNKLAVEETIKVWSSSCPNPKSPPIDWLKQEVAHACPPIVAQKPTLLRIIDTYFIPIYIYIFNTVVGYHSHIKVGFWL